MNELKITEGFTCTKCKKEHKFSGYVFAHWNEFLTHECECGAVHQIHKGRAKKHHPWRTRVYPKKAR